VSTGGVVTNTGVALHRLGVPVQLIGKIGEDLFGKAIKEILGRESPLLFDDLVVDPGASTSFTVILNPPGFDRTFIHSEGANAIFYASDLPKGTLQQADLFHFGYPSLMRSIYRSEGAELVSILQKARRAGLSTSLDFSLPDPTSPAGRVDWPTIMDNCLPYVDLFVPSAEELTFLLERENYEQMSTDPDRSFPDLVTPDFCRALSEKVLCYGLKAVLIKVGHRGIYLRSAGAESWKQVGRGLKDLGSNWHNRELWAPAFGVNVRGTTGAGDAAIAGFLASILQGSDPETALIMAAAAGACSVEGWDSTSAIGTWEEVFARVKQGWATLPLDLAPYGWKKSPSNELWIKG